MKKTTIALFAAIGLASTPALAGRADRSEPHHGFRSAQHQEIHHALEQRDDLLQRRSNTFRIGAVERQEIAKERREIRKLQDRLEAGEAVDSYTLYRALGGEQHVIYFDADFS
jgi:transcription elongation GreA/GreB family factor